MKLHQSVPLSLITVFAWTVCAFAQPIPAVNAPAPISVQRGQTADVTLPGASLGNVSSVALPEDSGLTATLAKSDKPDAEAKLTLKADADAKPGMREIRLVSPTGVSNPVQVWVEQYPLVVDTAPNTDPAKPQPISLRRSSPARSTRPATSTTTASPRSRASSSSST